VAVAKIAYGYTSGAVSILSDGFHSLTDSSSNVVALVGLRVARRPPDLNHPYGHRKYETMTSVVIVVFLTVVMLELGRTAWARLESGQSPEVTATSFVVMLGTLAVNLVVVNYERREARRLSSELLLADALHTRSDVLTSLAVIGALVGVWLGAPWLDAAAAGVVAIFIGQAAFQIAREASGILSDQRVIPTEDIRAVVMQVDGVLGCHQIRTRGSADQVFLDLHVWSAGDQTLNEAHRLSHVVKDRLMAAYPQITDAVIHIEPPPAQIPGATAES
jgi:cation diffusion facilitator family transporter